MGSSVGGCGDDDKVLMYSTTITGVSPLGLPFLAPLTLRLPWKVFGSGVCKSVEIKKENKTKKKNKTSSCENLCVFKLS